MKELKDVVFCVVDRGTFYEVAQRLARDVAKVYYCSPKGEGFETVTGDCIGHGHPEVETVRDFWPIKNEIDCFVFPDCRDWGLQRELESQGFPVWGSREAEDLENLRGQWLEVAKEVGLMMPPTEEIQGLENLRAYLFENKEQKKFVKFSRYRGDMETWCADNWLTTTRPKLDLLAHKWQGLQNALKFYVQDDVNTDIEAGLDGYFVGDFPEQLILGYEKKNLGYFGAVMDRDKIPPEVWKPSEVLIPVLRARGYRNCFSTEVRIDGSDSYLLDPCCRFASPAGEPLLEMLANFAEIVWHGAHGELIQPQWSAPYCGQIMMTWSNPDKDTAKCLQVPPEVRRWVKLYGCALVDGSYQFPPGQDPGSIVAVGETPEEVLDRLKEVREEMSSQPVEMRIEPIAGLIGDINKAKEQGIEFGEGDKLPEPVEVLDDAV